MQIYVYRIFKGLIVLKCCFSAVWSKVIALFGQWNKGGFQITITTNQRPIIIAADLFI